MIKTSIRLALLAGFLLPSLLPARTTLPWTPHKVGSHVKPASAAPTAKVSASQAVVADDLKGFWSRKMEDLSVEGYADYDTAEVLFGADGKWESRESIRSIDSSDAENNYLALWIEVGTWKIDGDYLVVTSTACTEYSDGGADDCLSGEDDSILAADLEVKTVDSKKTLSLDIDYPEEDLTYIGANAAFTLEAPAVDVFAHAGSKISRKSQLVLRVGSGMLPAASGALDLRGRAISGFLRGQGLYIRR